MDILSFEPVVVQLADALRRRGWQVAAAESCTGGLVAAACTALAGSSDWFERGFVSYSNQAKTEMLGVDAALISARRALSAKPWRGPWCWALCSARAPHWQWR